MSTQRQGEPAAPPQLLVEMEVGAAEEAEDLVRELEMREIEAAKVPDAETVRVSVGATEDGDPLLLEPLIALEGWLAERGVEAASLRVDGQSHVVRSRGEGRTESAEPSSSDAAPRPRD